MASVRINRHGVTLVVGLLAILMPWTLLRQLPPADASPAAARTITFLDTFDGGLLTPESVIHARITGKAAGGVSFSFLPSTPPRPIPLGTDTEALEPAAGPGCGRAGCMVTNEYAVGTGPLAGTAETWGTLTATIVGSRASSSVRTYWDETPPQETFQVPRYSRAAARWRGVLPSCPPRPLIRTSAT